MEGVKVTRWEIGRGWVEVRRVEMKKIESFEKLIDKMRCMDREGGCGMGRLRMRSGGKLIDEMWIGGVVPPTRQRRPRIGSE